LGIPLDQCVVWETLMPGVRRTTRQKKAGFDLRAMLAGSDRRSIGRSSEAVTLVQRYPKHTRHLVKLLWNRDPGIAMRAADALEKLTRDQPNLLEPHKAPLLGLLAETTQQEIRWHLAVIVPRLRLTGPECRRIVQVLQTYLEDRSSIVKTFAMQGLADLTLQRSDLRPAIIELIRPLTRDGTPAMRARGRHLLQELEPGIMEGRATLR
jgi:hypothetical protein